MIFYSFALLIAVVLLTKAASLFIWIILPIITEHILLDKPQENNPGTL